MKVHAGGIQGLNVLILWLKLFVQLGAAGRHGSAACRLSQQQ